MTNQQFVNTTGFIDTHKIWHLVLKFLTEARGTQPAWYRHCNTTVGKQVLVCIIRRYNFKNMMQNKYCMVLIQNIKFCG